MQIIKPIQDSNLEIVSTNVGILENAWAPGNYKEGDLVQNNDDIVYRAALDLDNTAPEPGVATDPHQEYWIIHGVTNPFKPFDGVINSRCIGPPVTSYELAISEIGGGLAFMSMINVMAISIVITNSVGTEVYNNYVDLIDAETGLYKTDLVLLDIPPYTYVNVTIDLIGDNSEILVGVIVYGRIYELGVSKYGGATSILDYSTKETDAFGNNTIQDGVFSRRVDNTLTTPAVNMRKVLDLLTEIRGTPVVWITTDKYDYQTILVVYGFYRDFDVSVNSCSQVNISVSIEGLSEGTFIEGFTWETIVWRYERTPPEFWSALVTADDSYSVMWDNIMVLGGDPVIHDLKNPGAESVIGVDWVSEEGIWGQRNLSPETNPGSGNYYFETAGVERCVLSQKLDIVADGIHSYNIDTDQIEIEATFLQAGDSENASKPLECHRAGVYFRFYDRDDVFISDTTPDLTGVIAWTTREYQKKMPIGTRYVEIVLQADPYLGLVGSYFDDIVVRSIIVPIVNIDSKGRTYFELNGYRYTKSINIKG